MHPRCMMDSDLFQTTDKGMGLISHPFSTGADMYYYKGEISGIPLSFAFRYSNTASYYEHWLCKCDPAVDCITVQEEDVSYWMNQWKVSDYAYSEFVYSCSYACDVLMKHSRIVMHGAAFRWNQQAYLFTAPSGTGKTTQLNHWRTLFENEVKVMNGDKPILEVHDNEVIVHPSPWKGKEGIGDDLLAAPLGGIIILQQDQNNMIERLSERDAAGRLFCRFYTTFTSEEEVKTAGRMLEQILNNVPVYLLRNKGDSDSAFMTHEYLLKELHV